MQNLSRYCILYCLPMSHKKEARLIWGNFIIRTGILRYKLVCAVFVHTVKIQISLRIRQVCSDLVFPPEEMLDPGLSIEHPSKTGLS